MEKKTWGHDALIALQRDIVEELTHSGELQADEAQIYTLQDRIYSLNEQRNVRTLELSNLDRKINFLVQSQLLKNSKKGEGDTFYFFDQSASQDNPLGDQKSDYSSFLYLLRIEPQYLAKAVLEIPFAEMDYVVQCLNFSLFPDLFQAREELYLLDLIKHIINYQVDMASEPTDVLRQNSFITKLLSGYTKRHFGQVHLVLSLKKPVLDFIEEASQSPIAMEMNPELIYKYLAGKDYDNSRTKEQNAEIPEVREQIERSTKKLESYSLMVLDGIISNLSSMPYGIRYLCKHMIISASRKFSLSEKQIFLMLSSFLILRYFNPALLCPDVFGIIDRELSANVRRPLVLLSKVIQNYANDTMFGGKEDFMQPLNDSRQQGIDMLKAYYSKVMEVPEPQEYYATVANLPVRKDDVRQSIFHNTCVTISPNQLYTIHRLMATHKEKLIPKFHPISFFLNKLGDPPANVERKEDKIFTMPLSTGEDDEVDDDTRLELQLRDMSENAAQAFTIIAFPDDFVIETNEQFVEFLKKAAEEEKDPEKKAIIERAFRVTDAIKRISRLSIMDELNKYVLYRQGYRTSLKKEKEEMLKSLETLNAEAHDSQAKETLYKDYLDNIIKSAFLLKLGSKKEYMEAKQIGPLEFSVSALEKLGCFAYPKEIENAQRKNITFSFLCVEPGRVEISLINSSTKETKTVLVGISPLLDLLTQQDTAKIHSFVFDLRAFIAFLTSEVAG